MERIIGKLEEFREDAKLQFKQIRDELLLIDAKLDQVHKAEWILYGKTAVLYSVMMVIVEFVLHKTLFTSGG